MCCLCVGHAKSHPLSHCLLPWYDAFVLCFFHPQPLTRCFLLLQLLLMTSYTGHFPLSSFPSTVSIGLLLHSVGEFAFSLRVLAYFPLYFHVFPVPCWWTFSVLLQLSVWDGMLDLFKSIKTATTASTAILMWAPELFFPDNNKIPQSMGCFLSAVWVTRPCSAARHSWEPPWAANTPTPPLRASARTGHNPSTCCCCALAVILLKDVIAFVCGSSQAHELFLGLLFFCPDPLQFGNFFWSDHKECAMSPHPSPCLLLHLSCHSGDGFHFIFSRFFKYWWFYTSWVCRK